MGLKQLAACVLLAGVAACGAQSHAQTSSVTMPPCSTWTASNGSTNVLELHQSQATFTGVIHSPDITAHLTGSIEQGDRFSGKAVVVSGISIPVHGVFTSRSVEFHGSSGTDTYTTSRSCPS